MSTELINYFEITFNDSPNPCFVTVIDTGEVAFMNYSMEKLVKECRCVNKSEDFTLEKYNQHFVEHSAVAKSLEKYRYTESHVHCAPIDKNFRVNSTLIEFSGVRYRLSKYFATSSYSSQMYTIDEAMTKSVEIFSYKKTFDETTYSFLELLGHFYQVDATYVVYFNQDLSDFHSHYYWALDPDSPPTKPSMEHFSIHDLVDWAETNAQDGILSCSALNSNLTEKDRYILDMFQVQSLVVGLIYNEEDACIGMVGFSNRAEVACDSRLLQAVTRFIQEGFTKAGMQEELKVIGETDFLTGFYSRPRYVNELSKYQMFPPAALGVVFINMNGLRKTNEYLGFSKGDEQIKKTSETLRQFFSEPFYRISGDEFVCFCEGDEEKEFLKKITRLQKDLKRTGDFPFAVGHAWKKGKVDVEALISEADTVMYINKQEYYHSTHRLASEEHDSVLRDLLSAISDEEFLVYLQPQIRLEDEEVIGAEALIRRFDKKANKMIFPDQFIPLYEQKSIIRHVDIFVLNKVCQLLSLWDKQGKLFPISVNLSRVTLIEFDIVNTIAKICDNYAVPHEMIVIEITERIGLIENEVATTLIDEFKEQGFRVSLDDFGCAYSNIITLATISVDEVKIDKSLVDNLLESKKNQIIVKSMIEMCNQFENTHTLAEGIEYVEQANILREYGCSYVQGYHYSRPIPNEEFFQKYVLQEKTSS